MALIKLPDGKYAARFYFYDGEGKRQRAQHTLGFVSKKQAQIQHDVLKASAHSTKAATEEKTEPQTFTLSKAIAFYLKQKGPSLGESTKYKVLNVHPKKWLAFFGDIDAEKLKKELIQGYINSRMVDISPKTKRPYSLATIYLEIDQLRSILQNAVENEKIRFNPFTTFKLKREPKKRREATFEKDELNRFFESFEGYQEKYKSFFQVLFYTGSRLTEIAKLNWSAVNWHKNQINIYQFKSKKGKTLPISNELMTVLKALHSNAKDKSGLIWKNCNGNAIRKETLDEVFKLVLKKSGIKKPLVPHSLRHTFATLALAEGQSMYLVSKALGHRNIQTTVDTYSHTDTEPLKPVVASVSLRTLPLDEGQKREENRAMVSGNPQKG
jgi:integrase